MRTLRNLILLCSMIITCAAAGQEVHVHFDKPHYFAGEYLFYSLTFSDISADSSCIAQIELGNTGAQIDRHFAQILEGKSAGYVKIPYDISSEVYFFSIDLFDNSGAKFQILQTAISVYNPEAAEWLEEQVVASQQQEADRTFGSLSITY
ncbi:MAG: hypothetical protein OEQ53_16415, partial [Saprospiraceae bacterium]|nr:hypothetical protein [Saprospiraceae bacterium]